MRYDFEIRNKAHKMGRSNKRKINILSHQLKRIARANAKPEFIRVRVARHMDQPYILDLAWNPQSNLMTLWVNGIRISDRAYIYMDGPDDDDDVDCLKITYLSTTLDDNFQLARIDLWRLIDSKLYGNKSIGSSPGLNDGDDLLFLILRGKTARNLSTDNIWDGLAMMALQHENNKK